MVSSKAMMTNGGKDTGALPPVISSHWSEVQIVRKKPVAVPVRPPISVKKRTLLSGRTFSISSSISSTGTGVYTVSSEKPFSRSFRIASSVVSTWAKTPRTLTAAMLVASPVGVLERVRQDLLHLDDRQRRHHADEPEEQQ